MLIKDRLKTIFDTQKSFVDLKHREVEYVVDDLVFLKVSPWKKALHFGCKGKLSPRFIGQFEVLEHVGLVMYRLRLTPELEHFYNVFYVSMLCRYRSNNSHVVSANEVDLSYE
ncbi:uncharacterized protein LOC120193009 [Hibiscus syriacus]|uniref:uncharacterized protein LOC120193009 n=1 Tax=Hibiscus syriacus TaxID=106335 RepID=UPI0019243823|nr:uncharacterized protein LOC120193009 [Hibiscus syriacus]